MKIVLVTGASRGIGQAIAKKFAESDYKVVGTATSDKGIDAIESLHANCVGMILDQSSTESIESLCAALKEKDLLPDFLINNAGVTADNLLLRMKDDEWGRVIHTNLTGVYKLTQRLLKPMIKKRDGAIINISSVIGSTGNGGQANYAAAKAGVVGFSKSLAQEVASRNIRVNVVAPGFIETDMTNKLTDAQRESTLAAIPMQRIGSVEEIAGTVHFLCTNSAKYITGQTIHVNGGMFMA